MGSGTWTAKSFDDYTFATKGMSMRSFASADNVRTQEVFKARHLSPVLNPKNVMRECRDSDEHPNTLPVILALDVTGSMGKAAVKVAQKLNEIMTDLYRDETISDIEFCVMGIGDLYCDMAPIQMSQFESDIRIAEQLDELFFEGGGGGNAYESYTAAWYMGVNHCDLDCWRRGKKGIIITMGDECPNPVLLKRGHHCGLEDATGDHVQDNISTAELLPQAQKKFDIYHISIDDKASSYRWNNRNHSVDDDWQGYLKDNYFVATLDSLASCIINIISNRNNVTSPSQAIKINSTFTSMEIPSDCNEISW